MEAIGAIMALGHKLSSGLMLELRPDPGDGVVVIRTPVRPKSDFADFHTIGGINLQLLLWF